MRRNQLEAWVGHIVHDLLKGRYREDARVEFKSEWPDDVQRAARRIAGHANASSPDPILWVVGVDERTRCLVPVTHGDTAPWFQGVQNEFEDGVSPDHKDVQVFVDDGSVHAILFETDRAPYVVKNPAYGQTRGEAVQREVPWRDGTAVRTAHRHELLRLLLERGFLPAIDVISADARVPAAPFNEVTLGLRSFVIPRQRNEPVVFLNHRCAGRVQLGVDVHPVSRVEMWRSGQARDSGRHGLVIERPEMIEIGAVFKLGEQPHANMAREGSARLVLPVARATNPAIIEIRLTMLRQEGNWRDWALSPESPEDPVDGPAIVAPR